MGSGGVPGLSITQSLMDDIFKEKVNTILQLANLLKKESVEYLIENNTAMVLLTLLIKELQELVDNK